MLKAKTEEVRGDWRRVHNEVFHNLHSTPNKIRTNNQRKKRWPGYVAQVREERSACRLLVGKPGGKRPIILDIGAQTILR
jgi:hypothetical protein